MGQVLRDGAKPAWRGGKDGCCLEQKSDMSHNGGELRVSAAATPLGFQPRPFGETILIITIQESLVDRDSFPSKAPP